MKREFRLGNRTDKKPKNAKLGNQKSMKARVNQHEKELAEDLGGFRQPASGALEGMKGDIKLDTFLLDSKETDTNSLILSTKELTKITREARECGREPGLIVTIHRLPVTVSKEWAVIPMELFADLLDRNPKESND
tara:strand:- start:717 stop:1124 length:408 start_codon:yes stop_codon:yes gene_type:complete